MNRSFAMTLMLTAGVALAAPQYPFPYNADYPHGIRPTLKSTTNADIQGVYEEWLKSYYTECPDGQKARIKWVDPAAAARGCSESGNCTVSEGIGYGMLILVYMDNTQNNNQAKFDKLFKYYNSYLDNKGLMKWIVEGCNGAKQDGAATDAEMDVILALLMASKQWKSDTYLSAAKQLLSKVWDAEVDQGQKLLKPGSQFASPYNPSYFAVGALRIFQSVDPSHDWKGVADNSLALIRKNQNPTTGLMSDWCSAGGQPQEHGGSGTGKFGYDAARTPWRVALDYLWFGTASAKQVLDPINKWIIGKTTSVPGRIRAEYSQDGSTNVTNWTNALYMGALTIPGMTDPSLATWVQASLNPLMNASGETYYNASWKILYQLTMSGNFQNFMGTVKPNGSGVETRKIPTGWRLTSSRTGLTLTLPGSGSVDLVDAGGVVVASAAGRQKIEMARPAQRGVYFAVVRAEGQRVVLPVVGD